jgi:hypothetical protein
VRLYGQQFLVDFHCPDVFFLLFTLNLFYDSGSTSAQ